jgi:hypothetical protein
MVWQMTSVQHADVSYQADRTEIAAASRVYQADLANYFTTGDATPLMASLAESFIDHNPFPGFEHDRAGFLDGLAALRATVPGMTVTATYTGVADGIATLHVVARVSAPGVFPATPGGTPSTEWRYNERLRFQFGQVIERWGPDLPFTLEAVQTSWQGGFGDGALRLTALQVTGEHVLPPGEALISVQSGSVRVRATNGVGVVRAGESAHGSLPLLTEVIVTPGDLVVASGGFVIGAEEPSLILIAAHETERLQMGPAMSVEVAEDPAAPASRLQAPGENESIRLSSMEPGMSAQFRFSRNDLLLPPGDVLPAPVDGAFQIVIVKAGELLANGEGEPLGVGEIMIAGGTHGTPAIVALAPAAVQIVSVSPVS